MPQFDEDLTILRDRETGLSAQGRSFEYLESDGSPRRQQSENRP